MTYKSVFLAKLLLLICINNTLFAIETFKSVSDLTKKEFNYLQNNEFTFAGDPNWLPFEAFNSNGEYIGIISEHLNIIENKLDIKFKKIPTKDWVSTLELSKKLGADIISGDAADVVLAKNYKPIDTYMKNPLVMVARDKHPFISDLNNLKDKKIAFIEGYGYSADSYKKYPDINFIEIGSAQDGLLGVKSGKFDIFIGALSMVDYTTIQMGIEGIKISGDTGITMNVTLFVNKNKPLLYTILNKSMNSIEDIKKHKIISQWRHGKIDKIITDYTLIWQIIGIFSLVLLIVLYFLIKQNRLNQQIQQLNQQLESEVKEAIEETQKNEQLLQQQSRLAQMGEMISMIAHQWRQPLAAISSTSGGIRLKATLNKLDKDTTIELSNKISEYAQHLSSTIDDFRDFFKTNKEKENITYNEIIDSVLNIVEDSIKNQNIKIIQNLNSQEIFNTYQNELRQVVLNLIKNAEDILIQKKIENPTIIIETKENILSISDNGGGIGEDIIGKIFDPYFSTKKEKDGTGLGLYMSKTIIEEHCDGELTVSNDDNGAVFTIVLPHSLK